MKRLVLVAAMLAMALACTLFPGVVAAQVAPAATVAAAAPAPSPAAGLMQVMFYLLLVLGLFAGIAYAMKRYGPKGIARQQNVKVVGGISLGGRERILVVEVAGQWIVVGAAPGRVNALATMARPDAAQLAQDAATLEPGAQPAKQFGDWLQQTLAKRNGNNEK
ncbi:MAG TPA: flagellar biosynthetic protein FliO [Burkholderiaceae bacterium]